MCTQNSSNAIKHCTVLKCLTHTDVRSILFFPTGRRKSRQNGKAVQQNQVNQLHRQKLSQSKTIVQRLVLCFRIFFCTEGSNNSPCFSLMFSQILKLWNATTLKLENYCVWCLTAILNPVGSHISCILHTSSLSYSSFQVKCFNQVPRHFVLRPSVMIAALERNSQRSQLVQIGIRHGNLVLLTVECQPLVSHVVI